MKEYIFQIDNVAAGNDIVVSNAPTGLTANNILAIINKTTGKPIHSPIAQVIDAVSYIGSTMTIKLSSDVTALAANDKVLIKCYTNNDGYAKEATAQQAAIDAAAAKDAAQAIVSLIGYTIQEIDGV